MGIKEKKDATKRQGIEILAAFDDVYNMHFLNPDVEVHAMPWHRHVQQFSELCLLALCLMQPPAHTGNS